MKPHLITTAVIGAAAVVITTAGCGGSTSTSTSTSSSSEASTSKSAAASSATSSVAPAAEQDYSKLLISAADIVAPDDTFTAQEPTLNPAGNPGVATVFSNAGDTREIGDTIFVLPDEDAAATALQGAIDAFATSVTGGPAESVPVGTSASMISGTSPDGAKAVTVLVFTDGPAFTTLQFDSLPDDPVPAEFVLDVAQKQDAAIKAGLGG